MNAESYISKIAEMQKEEIDDFYTLHWDFGMQFRVQFPTEMHD